LGNKWLIAPGNTMTRRFLLKPYPVVQVIIVNSSLSYPDVGEKRAPLDHCATSG